MTREERIAAGWVECWTVAAPNEKTWSTGVDCTGECKGPMWTEKPMAAKLWETEREAFKWILAFETWANNAASLRIRRRWRRKKPKATPPLAAGETVWVKATVVSWAEVEGHVRIETKGKHGSFLTHVRPEDVERVKP